MRFPGLTGSSQMIVMLLIFFIITFIPPPPGAAASGNPQLTAAQKKIEFSLHARDINGVKEAISLLNGLQNTVDAKAPEKKYVHYYKGYAHYLISNSFPSVGKKEREEHLNDAVHSLEAAVKLDPAFAEAHALLASAYGSKANGLISRIQYGLKYINTMQKALEIAPENPRVVLADGIGTFYKPKVFGGGVKSAVKKLERAQELFKQWESPNEWSPNWGHEMALAWLGKAYMELGNFQGAKQAYREALKIRPGYYWVLEELLPEVEKAIETKRG